MSADNDWVAIQTALKQWVMAASGLPADKVVWGQQQGAPRPPAPAIIMRVSHIGEIGLPWVDQARNPFTFATKTVTSVDATADTLAIVAHGLLTGDGPVEVASTGVLPGGTAASTQYWIIAPDADHVQLAATYADTGGGQGSTNPVTHLDLTSVGAGTITLSATADTVRAGAEIANIARGLERVTLELRCHAATGFGLDMATSILNRVRRRRVWPTQRAALAAVNVAVIDADRVRAIQGIKDALLFEPRAYLDVHLCVAAEDADTETETVIEVVGVQDQVNGETFDVTLT